MNGKRLGGLVASLALTLSLSCVQPPRWTASDEPTPELARVLIETDQPERLALVTGPAELPAIPVRERLRPCCAFGSNLRLSAGAVPIPAHRLPNVIGPDQLGPHTYDAGIVHRRASGDEEFAINRERNGLVYTCRGGFIDTAHVRDYLDWTAYFGSQLAAAALGSGTREIALPDEGGSRRVRIGELPPLFGSELLAAVRGSAEWLAFQLSVWHEIATWYGYESIPGFPEQASAFSPEDFYSNLLGTKLAAVMIQRRSLRTEPLFNHSATQWIAEALAALRAVPREVGEDAMQALDGVWWNSQARVSQKELLLRRSFAIGNPIEPWRVPDALAPESLRKACAGATPAPLANPDAEHGVRFASWVMLEIDVDPAILAQPGFPKLGPRITQADFPAIVAAAHVQNREEAGPDADHP